MYYIYHTVLQGTLIKNNSVKFSKVLTGPKSSSFPIEKFSIAFQVFSNQFFTVFLVIYKITFFVIIATPIFDYS